MSIPGYGKSLLNYHYHWIFIMHKDKKVHRFAIRGELFERERDRSFITQKDDRKRWQKMMTENWQKKVTEKDDSESWQKKMTEQGDRKRWQKKMAEKGDRERWQKRKQNKVAEKDDLVNHHAKVYNF